LAKVAAVNCDEDSNKGFCGSMGVQGFPTLKIVKPGKKPGKPFVEDYQGQRSAKAIVDAVIDKIPNHVKRLTDKDYQPWLEDGDGPKAILFSEKGSVSALLKAIAIDFLGGVSVAQMRDKEAEAVKVFGVEKYPTLVLLPGGGNDPMTYGGEMKKDKMVEFLSQAAAPNPDPPAKKAKADKYKASSKASSSFAEASRSHASEEAKTDKASQTMETLEDESQPTESPDPIIPQGGTYIPFPVTDGPPPIPTYMDDVPLQQRCLNDKSGPCILALLPYGLNDDFTKQPEEVKQALSSLSEIHHKHDIAQRSLFPFFQVPNDNPMNAILRKELSLAAEGTEIIAINGKRDWYRHYPHNTFPQAEVEDWIDAIRMGDSAKTKVPTGVIVEFESLPTDPFFNKMPMPDKDPEAISRAIKEQFPEGVEFEVEEIDDNDYEKIIKEAKEGAEQREAAESVVEEEKGKKSDEPIEHIEL
jgi:protein disulfide-isomerase A6